MIESRQQRSEGESQLVHPCSSSPDPLGLGLGNKHGYGVVAWKRCRKIGCFEASDEAQSLLHVTNYKHCFDPCKVVEHRWRRLFCFQFFDLVDQVRDSFSEATELDE